MSARDRIKPVPWDRTAFGCECYELADADAATLAAALAQPGHYTVKVDPLADKRALHEAGFYYCDTLIEPWCVPRALAVFDDAASGLDLAPALAPLAAICRSAFAHGRFHRDFNLEPARADRRYENWLGQLHAEGRVIGLTHAGKPAGFIAHVDGALVLHALGEAWRGRGLAKYWWSATARHLFAQGCGEVRSSISSANLAVLNLYASLGFRFRKPLDVYHRMVP